jgi:hypothetical protein
MMTIGGYSLEESSPRAEWLERPALQNLLDELAARGFETLGPVLRDGALMLESVRCVEDLPSGWRDIQGPGSYRVEPTGSERVFDVLHGHSGLKSLTFAPREELLQIETEGVGRPFVARPCLPCFPSEECGRLFDAVACILDLGDRASHEGELASALESLAASSDRAWVFKDAPAVKRGIIPVSSLVRDLACAHAPGEPLPALARGFHVGLATRLAKAAVAASRATGLRDIVLSGGCLQNRLLRSELETRLAGSGLRPLVHERIPPSDGGLAVGQAAVAGR